MRTEFDAETQRQDEENNSLIFVMKKILIEDIKSAKACEFDCRCNNGNPELTYTPSKPKAALKALAKKHGNLDGYRYFYEEDAKKEILKALKPENPLLSSDAAVALDDLLAQIFNKTETITV